MTGRTVIVGGGLAGLAAAAALAKHGIPVTLLESRPRLGGRASSFVDQTSGEQIDNCQHVALGCCTNFTHFCELVGIGDSFRTEPELYFIGRDGVVNHFSASSLPAPLHLFFAFRRLSYLSSSEKRALSRGLRALAKCNLAEWSNLTFAKWLAEQQQPQACIDRFWNVVLVSALSETPDRISVAHARKVFVDAFLANRDGWKMRLPTVPLDELYGGQLTNWLREHDAQVRLQAGVERLIVDAERARAVQLRSGEWIEANHVVVAVPQYLVLSLLPEELRQHAELGGITKLEPAPITSVHLWFNHPITDLPHAVLVDRLSQWVFNRSAIHSSECMELAEAGEQRVMTVNSERPASERAGYYYQVVVSASHALKGRAAQEIIDEVVRELGEIWPAARETSLLHARVVTEHKAVFAPFPGVDDLRPVQQSPIANLQLAGDWTRTGWPATMEGAVRSGYLAAENILRQLGRLERLVQPDLRTSLLSKWLLRL